jgi:hypothetical protein
MKESSGRIVSLILRQEITDPVLAICDRKFILISSFGVLPASSSTASLLELRAKKHGAVELNGASAAASVIFVRRPFLLKHDF